ncbi:MAG: acetate/propionate family kinase [Solirubrobacteraceae bacterium]|jgi:acetate kinase
MRVLVVNAGSSSLKLVLLDGDDEILAEEELPAPRAQIDDAALRRALDSGLGSADAIGHRIVHGGEHFREAVLIDAGVEADLRVLVDLAPLHQPKSLAALDAVTALLPDLPAVACFDTAFHATLPAAAATYALPADWRARWDLRRYGFHGLSHAWVARRAPQLLERDPAGLRIVSCHLGAGASLCAIGDGRSLDTTMGFTPLEGLVMATRSGSVDPGLLLWLIEHEGLSAPELADALEHRSGLLGLAGTADMRELVERVGVDDGSRIGQTARLALDVYVHRLRSGIAAMAASLGGLDALVFTGGVGEGSATVRELATDGLGFLGAALDAGRNASLQSATDTDVSAADASARTLVIAAREDLEIARQVRSVLGR